MFENMSEVTILLVVGLFCGVLISWLYWRGQVSKREGFIEDLETSLKGNDDDLRDFQKHLQEQEAKIESLSTQLSQRDETISGLTARIKEKDNSINVVKMEALYARARATRAEELLVRVGELENSLEEKEQEVAALKARSRAMQDNFTYIVGIGPKVSAVLRSAGINTFAKLATTDVNGIRDILKAENPSLLRLTDPSTWPEQARMAAEEEWGALSALHDSLKESRRS
jgi:predicted flap endonuclease-1-like 5' DNA nuclease